MRIQITSLCAILLLTGCFGETNPGPSDQFPRGNRSWNGTPPDGMMPPEGGFGGGGPMMNMTVADMAQRDGIDAELFLNTLVLEFGLTGNYTINTPFDELMSEGKINPMDMRTIIDGLK